MTEELLPCPFCGSEAEVYARADHVPQIASDNTATLVDAMWVADCTKCNANIELEDTRDAAIKAWNTRTNQTTITNEKEE